MDAQNKTSDAQKRAVKKYLSKFVDIKLRVQAEERERIQAHAAQRNESVSAFLKRAIGETMERDMEKDGQ